MKKIDNTIRKTVYVMLGFSAFAFVFHQVYVHYSHGLDSVAMKMMFLTILIFGAQFYGLLGLFKPQIRDIKYYRLFTNLYNSGLASVVIGQLIQGIVEIAGTGSDYIVYYYTFGIAMMTSGILLLGIGAFKEVRHNQKLMSE